jgi:biotin carboxylase
VVVVDPFSTGAVLAADLFQRGYKVIALYSANLDQLLNVANLVPKGVTVSFEAVVPFDDNLGVIQERLAALKAVRVVAVLPGAETGVELADALSEAMGLVTNGTAQSEARRNKYVMGETIRAAGLRAVRQQRATTWQEVEGFLADWTPNPFKLIVKPLESAGSDDVTLCHSLPEARKAFEHIMGKVNGLGLVNEAVLVQEYLEGQEYVLDLVSRNGVHKVAALWVYDRRAVNGAGFVCFGQRLLTADEPHLREMIEYQKKVITALGIKHGPTHGELKWCNGEPVLVEVGARCHGAEGMWQKVANAVYGYDQVQCTLESYFSAEKFAAIPDEVRITVVPHKYRRGVLNDWYFAADHAPVLRPHVVPDRVQGRCRRRLQCRAPAGNRANALPRVDRAVLQRWQCGPQNRRLFHIWRRGAHAARRRGDAAAGLQPHPRNRRDRIHSLCIDKLQCNAIGRRVRVQLPSQRGHHRLG